MFSDPIAKKACVEQFDTNGDGELSYKEAAAVISVENLFKDYQSVTTFDEFQFFIGLKEVSRRAFVNCGHLRSVVLPENVISINDYAFSNCYSLIQLDLPSKLERIGDYAFYNTGIQELNLPPCFKQLGKNSFYYSSLRSIIFPEGITTIPSWAFASSSSLMKAVLPASLTTIGELAFSDCPILNLIIPQNVSSIQHGALSGAIPMNTIITGQSLPDVVQSSFGNSAIYMPDVLLPDARIKTGWYDKHLYSISEYAGPHINKYDNGISLVVVNGVFEIKMNLVQTGHDDFSPFYISEDPVLNINPIRIYLALWFGLIDTYPLGGSDSYAMSDAEMARLVENMNQQLGVQFHISTEEEKMIAGKENYSYTRFLVISASELVD